MSLALPATLRIQGSRIAKRLGYRVRVRPVNFDEATTLCGVSQIPFATVLDVGANIGTTAAEYLKMFPRATVHAFEPNPRAFKDLTAVAARSQGRIIPHQLGLGAANAELPFYDHVEHPSSSSFLESTPVAHLHYPFVAQQQRVYAPVSRLDDFARDHPEILKGPIFCKIDVQGYELQVLEGGRQTFRACTAVLVEVGLDNLYKGQSSFTDVHQLMGELGFTFRGCPAQYTVEGGAVAFVDALFARQTLSQASREAT